MAEHRGGHHDHHLSPAPAVPPPRFSSCWPSPASAPPGSTPSTWSTSIPTTRTPSPRVSCTEEMILFSSPLVSIASLQCERLIFKLEKFWLRIKWTDTFLVKGQLLMETNCFNLHG